MKQFFSRVRTLQQNGHPIDKIEVICLGGTFSNFRHSYVDEFIRDIYYSANVFKKGVHRERLSLLDEQKINETSDCHIVGLSLETRPDCINANEIKRFRNYGCTRVQLGIQHTNDHILHLMNRGHKVYHSIRAIKMLKEAGFKVEIHVMPDLLGTTPELDKDMFDKVLLSDDFHPDYLKIYPCLDVKYTKIRELKKNGIWKPYAEENNGEKLVDVVIYGLERINYWTRLSRCQRDFPEEHDNNNHIGYSSKNIRSNFYQLVQNEMNKQGKICRDIRTREVRNKQIDIDNVFLFKEKFTASNGVEYFLSYETKNRDTLYGFLRLRFNNNLDKNVFDCLKNSSIIRELHVYGEVKPVNEKLNEKTTQHHGFGKKLIKEAEKITVEEFNLNKIAVISAVGTREYYRKLGYQLENTYMIKLLS